MGKIKKAYVSELERVNRTVFLCYMIEVITIWLAYILEVVKGSRTIGYFLAFSATVWIPAIILIVMIKTKPDSRYFRVVLIPGFAVMYTFALYTTTNKLTFVYAMPMLLAITMYNSVQVSLLSSIAATLLNLIQVIYFAITRGMTPEDTATAEIQVLIMVFVGGYAIILNKSAQAGNADKLAQVEAQKEQTSMLLNSIVTLSGNITQGIFDVKNHMENLGESASKSLSAMEEVTQGSAETAASVQSQLTKTEEIQNHVHKVEQATSTIVHNVDDAKNAISQGNATLRSMLDQVKITERYSNRVAEELSKLDEYTQQMHSIVELINNVADQTSLLSLNASIEAARAGEAGRGFAVVASEISSLAGQTQDATENIETLIQNISDKLEGVIGAINSLVDANSQQAGSAINTEESFTVIADKVTSITANTHELSQIVKLLAVANAGIVESVENISAITEEVAAHANETYASNEANTKTVKEVGAIVERLSRQAQELAEHR